MIDTQTYDTYDGVVEDNDEFFGYQFKTARKVSTVIYTEGLHYTDGGWFKNGNIRVEILKNGEWQTAEATVSPANPNGDEQGNFGNSFETYTFTLKEATECEGVRMIGKAGAKDDFVSINELSVQ